MQKLYAIRDSKAECFPHPPFLQKTHGEAERTFANLVNNKDTFIGKYPDDYDLYFIGEFDDRTGNLHPLDTPTHILKASMIPKQ